MLDSGPFIVKIERLEDELEVARERIRELEAALGADDLLLPLRMLGLSQAESRIVNLLRKRDYATKEQLSLAVYIDDPERRFDVQPKCLDVMVHTTREKLAGWGVTFTTLARGQNPGYRMAGPDKGRLARLIATGARRIQPPARPRARAA